VLARSRERSKEKPRLESSGLYPTGVRRSCALCVSLQQKQLLQLATLCETAWGLKNS
jgi:hypothetical protein